MRKILQISLLSLEVAKNWNVCNRMFLLINPPPLLGSSPPLYLVSPRSLLLCSPIVDPVNLPLIDPNSTSTLSLFLLYSYYYEDGVKKYLKFSVTLF
jgi:hypothetical protein